jgi:glucose/arabinose dehydrogenase
MKPFCPPYRRPARALIFPALALIFSPLLGGIASSYAGPKAGDIVETEAATFRVEVFAEKLDSPWGLVKLPDGRFLVTEKKGNLRLLSPESEAGEPIANVPEVRNRGQGGLMDIELHPDYEKNGWLYLAYSDPLDDGGKGHTRVIRAKLKDGALAEVETIFKAPEDQYTGSGIHFGCRLEFDGDHFLFFSIGERGDQNKAQRKDFAQGGIHRVHDDGRIPRDNPFVDEPGAIKSLWTWGNRNPQGLRFQPGTGLLWSTEHGPKGGDELNIIRKGANYGWPVITYGVNYNGTPISDKTEAPGMEQPVIHWTPSIAVCGIDFYTGDKFPGWKGNLFAGALAHQKLTRVVIEGEKVTHQEIMLEGLGRMRDVRCFDDGFLYIVLDQGRIIRLVPAS